MWHAEPRLPSQSKTMPGRPWTTVRAEVNTNKFDVTVKRGVNSVLDAAYRRCVAAACQAFCGLLQAILALCTCDTLRCGSLSTSRTYLADQIPETSVPCSRTGVERGISVTIGIRHQAALPTSILSQTVWASTNRLDCLAERAPVISVHVSLQTALCFWVD